MTEDRGASRSRVLQAVQEAPAGLGVVELTQQVGLHANTVRFHLQRLIADGRVASHAEDRDQPGRPRLVFTALDAGTHAGRRTYRLLAEILSSVVGARPDATEVATEAGRSWGRFLAEGPPPFRRTTEEAAVTELMRILDDVGFEPEIEAAQAEPVDRGREIRLRHCPFLEVAREHREVVCSVHLGLMQGALAEMRAPVVADSLHPFVEPSLCVARLAATA